MLSSRSSCHFLLLCLASIGIIGSRFSTYRLVQFFGTTSKPRFDESDWIEHVTEKPWVNSQDFISAFEEAKKIVAEGII
jgi:hypothetical protein